MNIKPNYQWLTLCIKLGSRQVYIDKHDSSQECFETIREISDYYYKKGRLDERKETKHKAQKIFKHFGI